MKYMPRRLPSAVGVIDRRKFQHWGKLPRWSDELDYGLWLKGARAFGAGSDIESREKQTNDYPRYANNRAGQHIQSASGNVEHALQG